MVAAGITKRIVMPTTPIIGIGTCACAETGHATASAMSVINSRRLIGLPEAQDQALYPLEIAHRSLTVRCPLWVKSGQTLERLHRPINARSGQEFAYSITSSARANGAGGTVIPGRRAVSALIASSNFVECTTGRSAGFTPLRMRPV